MSNSSKIGKLLIGAGAAIAFLSRQKITVGVKGVYLNGLVSESSIPLRVVVYISNRTILGSLLIRSISGVLVSSGRTVATIDQIVNRRIGAGKYIEHSLLININGVEAMQAIWANIQSGNIQSLAFDLMGEIVVGEQWPVPIRFKKLFTYNEIQQML